MKKVYIIQRVLTTYRVPFFSQLREALAERGIELNLIYGRGNKADQERGYLAELPWGMCVKENYIRIGKDYLVLQPYWRSLPDADLIIVTQEMKLLLNYFLLFRRKSGHFKLAYWGHSVNFQEDGNSFKNNIKRRLNNAADWWFVYTNGEARLIESQGFLRQKVTVVQNSIDTNSLSQFKGKVREEEIKAIRSSLGIKPGQPVGLYCGGMYKEKKLDFLWKSCQQIKKALPDFHVIFVGGGAEEDKLKTVSRENDWAHFVGPLFDRDQVLYFMVSDVLLMPGLVGLVILDCFALEVPLITTRYAFHSPEIEYLEKGQNGIMTKDDIDEYCRVVVEVLGNRNVLNSLKEGCRISARKYSVERMVENFSEGIVKCLDQRK